MLQGALRVIAPASLVVLSACGGGGSAAAPTPTPYQANSTADIFGVAPLSWTCLPFYSEAGPVTVSVAPETSVELSMNGCETAETQVLGQSDKGYVSVTMPSGAKRVRVYNASAASGTFHLVFTYTLFR